MCVLTLFVLRRGFEFFAGSERFRFGIILVVLVGACFIYSVVVFGEGSSVGGQLGSFFSLPTISGQRPRSEAGDFKFTHSQAPSTPPLTEQSTDVLPQSTDGLPQSTDVLPQSTDGLPQSTDVLPCCLDGTRRTKCVACPKTSSDKKAAVTASFKAPKKPGLSMKFFLKKFRNPKKARAAYQREYRKTNAGKAASYKARTNYNGSTGGKVTLARAHKKYMGSTGGKAARARANKKAQERVDYYTGKRFRGPPRPTSGKQLDALHTADPDSGLITRANVQLLAKRVQKSINKRGGTPITWNVHRQWLQRACRRKQTCKARVIILGAGVEAKTGSGLVFGVWNSFEWQPSAKCIDPSSGFICGRLVLAPAMHAQLGFCSTLEATITLVNKELQDPDVVRVTFTERCIKINPVVTLNP